MIKKLRKNQKTHEQFVKEVQTKFGDVYNILGEYEGTNTKMLVEHKCEDTEHYKWMISPSNLLHGKGLCPRCVNKERGEEAFKKKMFDMVGDEYELIGKYVNARDFLTLKHNTEKCHHEFDVRATLFLYSDVRCPFCTSTPSKGERDIFRLLDNNKIHYKRQYWFQNCNYKAHLRFDFAILDNDENLAFLIEYQGKQHYSPQTFNGMSKEKAIETFKETQIRDNIKKEYCKNNDISLLEITYKEKKYLDEILLNELNKYKLIAH